MEDIKISLINLKLIELQVTNFKSFAKRKTFTDFKNFNCILGPNGCGKSNFMDAISFVLGEKTSKLRVKKLEELIHNSSNEEVAIRIKTASVEATFTAVNNDTAEDEILTFCRTIKQSNSTYCLNNQIVSKEQYTGKLKQCGMNVKYPNFLVYQSQIEKIALQNPEELRQYFEYIAGSTDLIQQYCDLTEEKKGLSKDRETLVKQKNVMKKSLHNAMETNKDYNLYLKDKNAYEDQERLKELICLFYLDKAIKDCTEKHNSEEACKTTLENASETLKNKLTEKRKQQQEKCKEVADSDEKIQKKQEDFSKMKLSVLRTKEVLVNATKKVTDCVALIQKNEEEVHACDDGIAEIKGKIKETKQNKEQNTISSITDEHKEQYRVLKHKAALLYGKRFGIHNDERENEADNDNIDTLQIQLKTLESYIKNNEDRKTFCTNRLTKLKEEHTKFLNVLASVKQNATKSSDMGTLLLALEENLMKEIGIQEDIQLSAAESRRADRKQQVLLELKNAFSGVIDRVTNCFTVRQEKYKIAVTTAVGMRNMHSIIVDTEVTGQQCIHYLRNHKYSPETFLPISFVKVQHFKKPHFDPASPVLVLLKDVLTYDRRFENIMAFICKGTYVCADKEILRTLYMDKINVVDYDGTFYQRSGLISGGKTDLAKRASLLTVETESQRQNKCDNLTRQVNTLKQDIRTTDRLIAEINVDQIKAALKVIVADIQETEETIRKIDLDLKKQESDLKNLTNEIKLLKSKVEEREAILKEIEVEVFHGFCANLNIQNIVEYENMEQTLFDIQREIDQLKLKLTYHHKLKQNIINKGTDLQTQLSEYENQRENVIKDEKRLSHNFSTISQQMDDLKKGRELKLKTLGEADADADKIKKEFTESSKALEALRNELKTLQIKISTLKNQFNKEFTRCMIDGIEIPLIESQASQDYETDHYRKVVINYEQIPEQYRKYNNTKDKKFCILLDKLKAEIRSLYVKKKSAEDSFAKYGKGKDTYIDSLRDKFQAKQDEYNAADKRYREIKQAMEKGEQTRIKRLVNLINDVKTIIRPMYSDLTGDTTGNVFMEFENHENPLEGGISFKVIAPQKPYMTMDSLSGGELTMAGILLLLAIQKYSRCPILILDEIDAPLDSINTAKLFKYLGKISADLQIFLITHNPEIHAQAKLLIGFTKYHIPETILKSKVVMLSCEQYDQTSDINQEFNVSILNF